MKQNRKMSTYDQLNLESLGSWPTMSKNFPGTEPVDKMEVLGQEMLPCQATPTNTTLKYCV